MNFPNIITTPCIPTTPPPLDPRCSDPAFAKAYPEICSTSGGPAVPILMLKPATVLTCALSPIQLTAFIDQGGVETELTSGVVFTTSDPTIALIGASSGAATGVASGNVTLTASYNGMTATSSLTVLGTGDSCCGDTAVATMLVVDVSKSMTLAFGAGYSTKEDYAKALAAMYAGQTNTQKDIIGLIHFDSAAATDVVLPSAPAPSNATDVQTAANSLASTLGLTSLGQALQAASTALLATSATLKVIVLFSDGENNDGTTANAPIPIAENFQAAGGIIVCVGIRAHGSGFNLLNGIATGGFFINSYPAIANDSLNALMGIKGYFCAGNCTPQGDAYEHKGQLDYNSFINWNVTAGTVDLQGNGFFDALPGNGLYVDLAGSGSPSNLLGTIESKTAFTFTPGVNYRLSFYLAGNNRSPDTSQSVQVQIGGGAIVNQTIAIPDYTQPFTRYSINFNVLSATTGKISFQQLQAAPTIYGNFLDNVLLENISNGSTIFTDTFDNENLQYVPPACGPSVTVPGYYGYSCYGYGCLTNPPGQQLQDPNPLADIESGYVPPSNYTSTQSFTAVCPAGSTQLNPVSVVPVMTSANTPSGVVTDTSETVGSEGWRAFGNWQSGSTTTSGWKTSIAGSQSLTYQFSAAQTILEFAITPSFPATAYTSTFQVFGSNDGTNFTALTAVISAVLQAGTRVLFPVTNPASYLYYRFVNTPTSSMTFGIGLLEYFIAATTNTGITKSATASSTISQQDAINKATAAASAAAYAALAYAGCAVVYTSNESATATCPCGTLGNPNSVTASATATSFVSQNDANTQATGAATALAAAQLICTASNNTSAITINDQTVPLVPEPATPYPSVYYVPPTTVTIAHLTVSILGFSHTYPQDVSFLLKSPSGKAVVLESHCGGNHSISGVNLVFDDAAGSSLPFASPLSNPASSGTIVSGTFKPTQQTNSVFPLCAPQSGYLTTLAAFIGDNPTGAWSLWVIDDKALDSGQIAGGWKLNITPPIAPTLGLTLGAGGNDTFNITWTGTPPAFWLLQISNDGGTTWGTYANVSGGITTIPENIAISATWSVIGSSQAGGSNPPFTTGRSNTVST